MAPGTEKIEQQLAILKIAGKGPGLKDAVGRALAEPGLFVYGELVQLPSIQQLQGTDQEFLLKTLQLFAFGTLADYKANEGGFLELREAHLLKLKQLTICTLATQHVVGYDALMQQLELPTVRALEDFIIQHCIYPGLLKCQLDQRHRRLHVQDVFARDVPPDRLPQLTQGLQALLGSVQQVMAELDQNVQRIAAAHAHGAHAQADFDRRLEEAKKSAATIEAMDTEGESLEAAPDLQHIMSGGRMGGIPGPSGSSRRARTGPDAKKSRK